MRLDLAAYLARQCLVAEQRVFWGGNTPLQVAAYLGQESPPLDYVTSVRSLVFRNDTILALREPGGMVIMPGGRREPGETLEETLRREVLEEAGWQLTDIMPLGVLHYRHLAPKRPGHPYPYPDFLQPVYHAQADVYVPDALLPNEYEREPYVFEQVTLIRDLDPVQQAFLDATSRTLGRR